MPKHDDQMQLNMSLPASLARGVRQLIEAGEFSTQAEYVRYLIRTDLDKRLPALDDRAGGRAARDNRPTP
jgi:Arc/MetJ-type ribon-helix-helix transcriptional regulator